MLVAANRSATQLSPALTYYHRKLQSAHALQVVKEVPCANAGGFARRDPVVVPVRTILSQLLQAR